MRKNNKLRFHKHTLTKNKSEVEVELLTSSPTRDEVFLGKKLHNKYFIFIQV